MVPPRRRAAMICGTVGVSEHLRTVLDIIGRGRGERPSRRPMSLILAALGTFFSAHPGDAGSQRRADRRRPTLLRSRRCAASASCPRWRCCRIPISARRHAFGRAMRAALPADPRAGSRPRDRGRDAGRSAVNEDIRNRCSPFPAQGQRPNLLVMPTLDAANIAFTLLRALSETRRSARSWSATALRRISSSPRSPCAA